jgi:hypothetical protein
MGDDARQRSEPSVHQSLGSEGNQIRRRQHRQQRQQQQEQINPYPTTDRELPEKQHQTRHPRPEEPDFGLLTGDQ